MSSKQTAENGKEPIPQNWLPESKKAKSSKPTNEEMEAELQKMFADDIISKTKPKVNVFML